MRERQGDERASSSLDLESPGDRSFLDLRIARLEGADGHGVRAGLGDRRLSSPADPRPAASVAEPRLHAPMHRDRPSESSDLTCQLSHGAPRPPAGTVIASVTEAAPVSVEKVVSRMLVPGT